MDRYTRKDAEKAFERLVKAIGGRIAVDYKDVGAYRLDWNATYGGGNIEMIANDKGGVSQPFGMMRRNAREFCDAVRFATDALAHAEKAPKVAALVSELESMIKVWENGWKVDRDIYISNARKAIADLQN